MTRKLTDDELAARRKWLSELSPKELKEHEAKIEYMRKKYAPGSEAAKARSAKALAARTKTGKALNPFTDEQKKMLKQMWYDDGLQPGVHAAYSREAGTCAPFFVTAGYTRLRTMPRPRYGELNGLGTICGR